MFVSAKIIKGKKATCFIACKDDVENAGWVNNVAVYHVICVLYTCDDIKDSMTCYSVM
jgi:putative intracellular protease/amidase